MRRLWLGLLWLMLCGVMSLYRADAATVAVMDFTTPTD